MSNILNHGEKLKIEYMEIKIPDNLDAVVFQGLSRGRQSVKRQHIRKVSSSVALFLLAVITSFTISVNVSSTFADNFSNIPILKQIVHILRFVNDEASGGQLTDSTDIDQMEIIESGETERFVIHFNQQEDFMDGVNAYNVEKFKQPNMIQFDIGGARMISATEDFETIQQLTYVKDLYKIITLDDSLIRFQLVLEEGVYAEVAETMDPNGLLVTLTKTGASSQEDKLIYVVRSRSYSMSESFGHLEEELFWLEKDALITGYRVMKDDNGGFLYELAQFESKSDAELYMEELKEKVSFELVIELREGADLPKSY